MTAWAGSVAVYAFVMSITPGPNNVLLAASGMRFGVRRSIPQLIGTLVGVAAMIALVAAGLGEVFAAMPWLQIALKIGGGCYLLWLAWHLWRSSELSDASLVRPMSALRSAGFQFINPKAWVMALSLVSGFLAPGPGYLVASIVALTVFAIVQCPSCLVWVGFGAALRRWLSSPWSLAIFNRGLAVATAGTIVLFWV